MKSDIEFLANKIKQAKRVLIFTHTRPDGDAFGSALALSVALNKINIPNEVCNDSKVPNNISFLVADDKITDKPNTSADLYVAVDSADESRLGYFADEFRLGNRKKETINIDHHISNTRYAKYNYVNVCSANCMNMLYLIKAMGVELDKDIANYLLLGMLTDSGNFSHDDVTGETLSAAADMVEAGANINFLNYNLFKKQPKERAALFAHVMSHIRYFFDDRFAVIVTTLNDLKNYNADKSLTEGFVDFPLSVDSVEVCASIMQFTDGQYKISLRSKKYADVNKIAGVFGGGGHVRASGCMIYGELEEVIDRLSYTVSQYL